MKIIINKITIYRILFLSLISKVFAMYYYSDVSLVDEWARIIHNKDISGVFALNIVLSEFVADPKFAEIGEKVLPTIFMPPLYIYFIYTIKFITGNFFNYVNVIILIQIILSLISIIILYLITKRLKISKNISILITCIFAFFPINIYATVQISSVTLQIFLILSFLYFLCLTNRDKIKNLIYLSFFSSLLILIRGEFFVFYLFTLVYFFYYLEKKIKSIFISIILTVMICSPYLIRNYNYFDAFVLTKSFGYNLLKGNNSTFIVEGSPEYIERNFDRKKLNIKADNKYEIKVDNFFKQKAINIIKENPYDYLKFYFVKVLSFVFFDLNSTYPNYYNPLHLFPKIILAITSLIGSVTSLYRKNYFQFLSIYYLFNILLFSIFFILPRYSLILLPIQLLLTINCIKFIKEKIDLLIQR